MGACGHRRECRHFPKVCLVSYFLQQVSTNNFYQEYSQLAPWDRSGCPNCPPFAKDRDLYTCLICGFAHCNNSDHTPTHAFRHFCHNTSHFMAILKDRSIYCYKCEGFVDFEALNEAGQETYTRVVNIFEHPNARFSLRPEPSFPLSPVVLPRSPTRLSIISEVNGDIMEEGEMDFDDEEFNRRHTEGFKKKTKAVRHESTTNISKKGGKARKFCRSNTEAVWDKSIKQVKNKAVETEKPYLKEMGINSDCDEPMVASPPKAEEEAKEKSAKPKRERPMRSRRNTTEVMRTPKKTDSNVKPTTKQALAKAKGKNTPLISKSKNEKALMEWASKYQQKTRTVPVSGRTSRTSRKHSLGEEEQSINEAIAEVMRGDNIEVEKVDVSLPLAGDDKANTNPAKLNKASNTASKKSLAGSNAENKKASKKVGLKTKHTENTNLKSKKKAKKLVKEKGHTKASDIEKLAKENTTVENEQKTKKEDVKTFEEEKDEIQVKIQRQPAPFEETDPAEAKGQIQFKCDEELKTDEKTSVVDEPSSTRNAFNKKDAAKSEFEENVNTLPLDEKADNSVNLNDKNEMWENNNDLPVQEDEVVVLNSGKLEEDNFLNNKHVADSVIKEDTAVHPKVTPEPTSQFVDNEVSSNQVKVDAAEDVIKESNSPEKCNDESTNQKVEGCLHPNDMLETAVESAINSHSDKNTAQGEIEGKHLEESKEPVIGHEDSSIGLKDKIAVDKAEAPYNTAIEDNRILEGHSPELINDKNKRWDDLPVQEDEVVVLKYGKYKSKSDEEEAQPYYNENIADSITKGGTVVHAEATPEPTSNFVDNKISSSQVKVDAAESAIDKNSSPENCSEPQKVEGYGYANDASAAENNKGVSIALINREEAVVELAEKNFPLPPHTDEFIIQGEIEGNSLEQSKRPVLENEDNKVALKDEVETHCNPVSENNGRLGDHRSEHEGNKVNYSTELVYSYDKANEKVVQNSLDEGAKESSDHSAENEITIKVAIDLIEESAEKEGNTEKFRGNKEKERKMCSERTEENFVPTPNGQGSISNQEIPQDCPLEDQHYVSSPVHKNEEPMLSSLSYDKIEVVEAASEYIAKMNTELPEETKKVGLTNKFSIKEDATFDQQKLDEEEEAASKLQQPFIDVENADENFFVAAEVNDFPLQLRTDDNQGVDQQITNVKEVESENTPTASENENASKIAFTYKEEVATMAEGINDVEANNVKDNLDTSQKATTTIYKAEDNSVKNDMGIIETAREDMHQVYEEDTKQKIISKDMDENEGEKIETENKLIPETYPSNERGLNFKEGSDTIEAKSEAKEGSDLASELIANVVQTQDNGSSKQEYMKDSETANEVQKREIPSPSSSINMEYGIQNKNGEINDAPLKCEEPYFGDINKLEQNEKELEPTDAMIKKDEYTSKPLLYDTVISKEVADETNSLEVVEKPNTSFECEDNALLNDMEIAVELVKNDNKYEENVASEGVVPESITKEIDKQNSASINEEESKFIKLNEPHEVEANEAYSIENASMNVIKQELNATKEKVLDFNKHTEVDGLQQNTSIFTKDQDISHQTASRSQAEYDSVKNQNVSAAIDPRSVECIVPNEPVEMKSEGEEELKKANQAEAEKGINLSEEGDKDVQNICEEKCRPETAEHAGIPATPVIVQEKELEETAGVGTEEKAESVVEDENKMLQAIEKDFTTEEKLDVAEKDRINPAKPEEVMEDNKEAFNDKQEFAVTDNRYEPIAEYTKTVEETKVDNKHEYLLVVTNIESDCHNHPSIEQNLVEQKADASLEEKLDHKNEYNDAGLPAQKNENKAPPNDTLEGSVESLKENKETVDKLEEKGDIKNNNSHALSPEYANSTSPQTSSTPLIESICAIDSKKPEDSLSNPVPITIAEKAEIAEKLEAAKAIEPSDSTRNPHASSIYSMNEKRGRNLESIVVASVSIQNPSNTTPTKHYSNNEISHTCELTIDPGFIKDTSKVMECDNTNNDISMLPVESIFVTSGSNIPQKAEHENEELKLPIKEDDPLEDESMIEEALKMVQDRLLSKKANLTGALESPMKSPLCPKKAIFQDASESPIAAKGQLESSQFISLNTFGFKPVDVEPSSDLSPAKQLGHPKSSKQLFGGAKSGASTFRKGAGKRRLVATEINSPVGSPRKGATIQLSSRGQYSQKSIGMGYSYSRISQTEVRKATSTQKHVRGMMNHGDTSHLNVILQSLYSLPLLVKSYLDTANSQWTSTKYNKKLKDFFNDYTKAYGPYDPLPFIMSTLVNDSLEYNVFHPHDPYDTMERILYALLQSQKVEEGTKDSETVLGKLFTNVVQTRRVCSRCENEEWVAQETQSFAVPLCEKDEVEEEFMEEKYVQQMMEGKEYYIPINARIKPGRDVNSVFCAGLHRARVETGYCEKCGTETTKMKEHYIQVPANLLFIKVVPTRRQKSFAVEINEVLGIEDVLMIERSNDAELNNKIETAGPEDSSLELCRYKLCAVVPKKQDDFHAVFVRHSDKWYYAKDSHVKQVTSLEVKQSSPYLLFYQRVNPTNAQLNNHYIILYLPSVFEIIFGLLQQSFLPLNLQSLLQRATCHLCFPLFRLHQPPPIHFFHIRFCLQLICKESYIVFGKDCQRRNG
eukprot:TRINITY_DN53_c0_g1_i3.p1 TRINITY_DN53_c0_g1~~TRINITY_DN53_c0_g1_i3.p1  ORF type:complete len:2617 (+),score=387.17 TRINITY_DN53_c0_g1_i3:26038-33888(+)